jgi:DNA-binding NarL/FixJ family response regulator
MDMGSEMTVGLLTFNKVCGEGMVLALERLGIVVAWLSTNSEEVGDLPACDVLIVGEGAASIDDAILPALRRAQPAARILVLGRAAGNARPAEMFARGAFGYVPASESVTEVARAISLLRAGHVYTSPSALTGLVQGVQSRPSRPLSARERQVLALAAEGISVSEMARRLHLSEGTIKTHLSSIYRFLDVRTRAEAVATAIREGMLEVPAGRPPARHRPA